MGGGPKLVMELVFLTKLKFHLPLHYTELRKRKVRGFYAYAAYFNMSKE